MKKYSLNISRLVTCAALIFSVPLFAGAEVRDPILMLGEGGSPDRHRIGYRYAETPGDSSGSPLITDQQLDAQFLVSQSTTDTWAIREKLARTHLSGPVPLPPSGMTVPPTLWSLESGGAYSHRLSNGNSVATIFSVGSDSDQLFHSIHETVLRASANYRLVLDPNHAWLFFITYSNNRHFANNIPLPGFAYYFYSPTYKVRALLGFPFISLMVTPAPAWEGRLSIFGPEHISTEINYRIIKPLQVYERFDWGQQQWLRANREDNSNQLFFNRKRLMTGFRYNVSSGLDIDTALGREFNRRWYEHDSTSYQGIPTTKLPDADFIEAKISYRYGQSK